MPKEIKPLNYSADSLRGISGKTVEIHHGKLYAGYVKKFNEIREKLRDLSASGQFEGNQIYSQLRGLRSGENFAHNGSYLHENYFDILGGDGVARGEIVTALAERYGSFKKFIDWFSAAAMAARGWAVLCWNINEQTFFIYSCDAQDHGGVWGCVPIIALDVYEHSYFIDTGSDRQTYINNFFDNLNWDKIEAIYQKAKQFKL
jgi:Fe-Mn family superoxide dismutase